ncbi:hypothetical protein PN36_03280 [Candidatus Thiomargarita nelsonii]|uniref:Uncharacterized protein n=1 Tax=Candidatus Thiomargarita nelsonii TaxID=1003181 RepID=A0A4E0R5K9_9GAMM|nr:hypothetical protein PN36_03280 [Candidatus Thiomargarita nelsonii]
MLIIIVNNGAVQKLNSTLLCVVKYFFDFFFQTQVWTPYAIFIYIVVAATKISTLLCVVKYFFAPDFPIILGWIREIRFFKKIGFL